MRDKPPDNLPPTVVAWQWVSRITTLAVEMVAPGLVGVWADSRLGTKVLFTLLGFAGGTTLAVWQLIKLSNQTKDRSTKTDLGDKRGQRGP